MKYLVLWLMTFTLIAGASSLVNADDTTASHKDFVAVITKIDGKAKVLSKEKIKKHKAKLGEELYGGDRLITYEGTTVLVELGDSSQVVLNASSELSFLDPDNLKQHSGEVYYKIKSRKATKGLKVETPFSIMGIKGTEFIVDAQGKGQIALNEGLVGIESLHANFELHKEKLMQEYEKFVNEQNAAFEAYKAELEGTEVSYVRSFDLEAGKVLNFSEADNCKEACESKVKEEVIPEQLKERFEMYNALLRAQ